MLGHTLRGDGVKSSVTMGVEGSSARTWMHTFSLQLMHASDLDRAVWAGRNALVECIEHEKCPQLLGVADFLRFFRVTLDYRREEALLQW
jgi:hypothetical protein